MPYLKLVRDRLVRKGIITKGIESGKIVGFQVAEYFGFDADITRAQ
jgi:hypothetical protein